MLARFFKIFSGVFLAHLVVLNIVWVGFSAPFPRPPATFIYEGALPADEDTGGAQKDVWQKSEMSGHFALDHFEASYFNHWITLRDPSKSFTYDHLGL
jgi:hypothetical protein